MSTFLDCSPKHHLLAQDTHNLKLGMAPPQLILQNKDCQQPPQLTDVILVQNTTHQEEHSGQGFCDILACLDIPCMDYGMRGKGILPSGQSFSDHSVELQWKMCAL
jgi:hypothetical protein